MPALLRMRFFPHYPPGLTGTPTRWTPRRHVVGHYRRPGNGNYFVLASTSMAIPLADSTRLIANQFDSGGNFIFTNAINPNWPQTFFSIQLQ